MKLKFKGSFYVFLMWNLSYKSLLPRNFQLEDYEKMQEIEKSVFLNFGFSNDEILIEQAKQMGIL